MTKVVPKKSKKEGYKKPAWLIKVENKIEKLSDDELDELFDTTYNKLKKGGLRSALGFKF